MRKFYRNMQFERSARSLGVVGLGLMSLCPLALLVIAAFAVFQFTTGHDLLHSATILHGHGLALAGLGTVAIPDRLQDHLIAGREDRFRNILGRTGIKASPLKILQFRKRQNPTYPGVQDAIMQPVYDSFSVAAAAAFPAQTVMFQVARGQAGKTLAQTNMQQSGQLPNPQSLLIQAIEVWIANNTAPVDLQNMLANVSFQLLIGTKPYLQCPLVNLPAGRGGVAYSAAQLGTAAAGDISFASTSNGAPDPRAVFTLQQNAIGLTQGEQFQVVITAETAFNMAAANARPNGNGTSLWVFLDGVLQRSVQ